ncbi:hypothetical protein [Xylanibacter brevis]|uniref:hypothetical protein n=1 Tax=Xylanibacter brevis TaxID=83231 RepID=UPI000AA270A6|nr:hypothetical protein [Xylanibacter brevis]
MNHFTVIANTTSSVLYLDIGNKATTRLFAELINGNPEADTVKYLQTVSQELKDRLHLLDAIGERV